MKMRVLAREILAVGSVQDVHQHSSFISQQRRGFLSPPIGKVFGSLGVCRAGRLFCQEVVGVEELKS